MGAKLRARARLLLLILASLALALAAAAAGPSSASTSASAAVSGANLAGPALVLVDPFTPYLSGHCREYCVEHGIEFVEAVSPYTASVLSFAGRDLPASFLAPDEGEERDWAESRELLSSSSSSSDRQVLTVSESDAGVATAERIQSVIAASSKASARGFNGISPHLRNKFEQNERAAAAGLPIVAQTLASTWAEAEAFLAKLWKIEGAEDQDGEEHACIIKPYRGVASDGVHLCSSLAEAREQFESLLGAPKYGSVGGKQEAVLVQEFAQGTEYAVDTVTCDGETKVVALWRYDKFAANGAPFVYQCSELVADPTSDECRQVMDYTVAMLQAQGLCFGPTHTEVKFTDKGPRLMEINARWHAQHFRPITQACLGNDALEITLDAFFRPERFAALPARPQPFPGRGLILHLVSFQEGTVAAVRHADTIRDLRSCLHLSLDYEPGMRLVKTVDIRTDCGYVLLAHKDAKVVGADYSYVRDELQRDLFELRAEPGPGEKKTVGEGGVGVDEEGEGEGGADKERDEKEGEGGAEERQGEEDKTKGKARPRAERTESAGVEESSPVANQQEKEGEGAASAEDAKDEDGQLGAGVRPRRSVFSRRRRERSSRLRSSETDSSAESPSQEQQPQSPKQPRQLYRKSLQPQPSQSQSQSQPLLEPDLTEPTLLERVGNRVLARLKRTAIGSVLLLGLGYSVSLAAVLLLPSAD